MSGDSHQLAEISVAVEAGEGLHSPIRVYIYPEFTAEDKGDGGVRRVVEAQHEWLPQYDIEIVKDPSVADVIAVHIAASKDLLQRYPNKPLVAHNHGLYWAEYDWNNWAYKANEDCIETIRQADAVTAPSEWVAQSIRRNSLRPVTVLYHGVDVGDWPVIRDPKSNYVLWNKTRPDPVCDPGAVVGLAKMAPDTQFITTFWPTESTLPGNVKVTGKLPYHEAKKLIENAGIYLCTTRETFGIGTLEAMAAGVPILGWGWGGQREFISQFEDGYLTRPGDYEDLLAGLRYCQEHRNEMGEAARQKVINHYQWQERMKAYADLYREVYERHSQPKPKVSVIVTAYNLEQYLSETLDSVLAQDMQDWECVVVDDASPDRCGAIAEEYASKDNRVRVVHNEKNQYLAGALNIGIRAARGKYIIPVDADNMLPPHTLRVLSGELDKDRSIHIAYGSVEFLEADGKRWHSGWPMGFRGEWQLKRRTSDGSRAANLVPSTSMFRKEMWECTGGYRRRYRTAEDADFWTRATSYGFRAKMVTNADILVYRNRPESMSRNEQLMDWTAWMPWCQRDILPPAAAILDKQPPVASLDPPLVSVIIPVGPGHEELLVDALDSVDAQEFRMWECIVVNDTGKPLRWIPSWARLLNTPGKMGVAYARNLGIKNARSSLFVPLDADDTLDPNALKRLFEIQAQFGGYVYSDWFERWTDGSREMGIWETDEYSPELLLSKGCLHAVTAIYRVEDWEAVGGFDENLPWEDWDFQLKLANVGICGTRIPEPLFTYRKDTGQRREENYAQFEGSKKAVQARWKDYFEGRKKLMACGGCSRGGGRVSVPQLPTTMQTTPVLPSGSGNYVLVEYIGDSIGSMNFRAPSGQIYRFSATATERQKYVLSNDADFFRGRREFRIAESSIPVGIA